LNRREARTFGAVVVTLIVLGIAPRHRRPSRRVNHAVRHRYNAGMQPRLLPDRRLVPRGGRRVGDPPGLSPLIMVLEPEAALRSSAEEILAVGRFAVAPVVSVEGALAICRRVVPAVIVCAESEVDRLRGELLPMILPIVAMLSDDDPGDLIERIRAAIRGRLPPDFAAV
jgi:hypothetical protein